LILAKCIKSNIDAINRCIELSPVSLRARDVSSLFALLIENLGKNYLETSFDLYLSYFYDCSVIDDQAHTDSKEPDNFDHLLVAKINNQMIELLQAHFHASILPVMIISPALYREIIATKNDFLQRLEQKMNLILQKNLSSIPTCFNIIDVCNWIDTILSRQKKTDFKPKDEYNISPTLVIL
jgi:hypothetical protein